MTLHQNEKKKLVAQSALQYIQDETIIGVGTGSTVNFFIEELKKSNLRLKGAVSSSEESTKRLKEINIDIYEANEVSKLDLYIDGADEINHNFEMIKGGGAALTREKIIAQISDKFICIADESKYVKTLGKFPLPIEVIPMARSQVGREIVKIGGDPVYRQNCITDNGNIILDVHNLMINEPKNLEEQLNNIPGIVTVGLFAKRKADILLLGTSDCVKNITL
ncbi:ribose 5-phosphate isomerase A [Paraphotobacterium marinum]|uniref:Ribose-5-phosphate isomerase A n=1 Tax=Paraphotobacterium marinum TaxID=1755811 RepID=A0A220VD37_9GAMM|nr:ribose-5-phosphate isomerase RpiA [Paraphotobacterium marinum]ASK77883.1 ribose 5-phosphate isomerase A [Paraphotobacterium marinum]